MVDIVNSTNALAEVDEVADRGEDIVKCDVLGNKLVNTLLYHFLQLVLVGSAFKDILQDLEGNKLVDAVLSGIEINIAVDIYHAVADDLDFLFLNTAHRLAACGIGIDLLVNDLQPYLAYACLLDLHSLVVGEKLSLVSHDLTCQGVSDRSCNVVTCDSGANAQLLVVLISSETGKIISLCIEEQHIQVRDSAVNCRRLAGAELLINLKKSFLGVLGSVLLEDSLAKSLIVTEHFLDLRVSSDAESTDKCGKRYLSVLINTNINNIGGVHLVFEPCASVGDNCSLKKVLTGLILFKGIVNAG